jgi:hypothetical protein
MSELESFKNSIRPDTFALYHSMTDEDLARMREAFKIDKEHVALGGVIDGFCEARIQMIDFIIEQRRKSG